MNLKKLIPELVEGLQEAGFTEEFKEIQSKSVPQIKSGGDLFIVSPNGGGKTTALIMGVIQQLKDQFEDAPRAIIMVGSKEKAFELEEQFELLAKRTELRVFTVFDRGVIQYQKDMIFEGVDIIIGTPKRLNELIKVDGIRLTKLKMFAVDDLETFTLNMYTMIYKVTECVPRAQYIMLSDGWGKNYDKLSERIMKNPKVVQV